MNKHRKGKLNFFFISSVFCTIPISKIQFRLNTFHSIQLKTIKLITIFFQANIICLKLPFKLPLYITT